MDVLNYISKLADDVVLGEINPITTARELKKIEETVKLAKEAIYEDLSNEVDKFSKEELKEQKIEKRRGKMTWDFKGIKAWASKKSELSAIEEKAKAAYKLSASNNVAIEETGEVVELPEVKYSRDSIILK